MAITVPITLERLVVDIRQQPERFRLFDSPIRRHFSEVFPYAVFYVDQPDRVLSLAAMHMKSSDLLMKSILVANLANSCLAFVLWGAYGRMHDWYRTVRALFSGHQSSGEQYWVMIDRLPPIAVGFAALALLVNILLLLTGQISRTIMWPSVVGSGLVFLFLLFVRV